MLLSQSILTGLIYLAHTAASEALKLNVQTSNGLIKGHEAQSRSAVAEFLGIPYAKPPVGDLRFAAPKAYDGKTSYTASSFGFDCPQSLRPPYELDFLTPQAQQIIDYFTGNSGSPQHEDCLTLNIWTKAQALEKCSPRPVLVFFYGGRTSIGATSSPIYNGQYLADAEDVLVVTVNYRLNIFGFPGAPEHIDNLGFRDQRLAVEWVRDNIAGFGGDPSKIAIWGQSAGGFAVDYWAYSYRDDPIVSGLISDSGNALSFPFNPVNLTVANWYNVSAEVGCGSDGDTIPCMRTKKWEDIEEAAANVPQASGGNPIRSVPAFYPKPDGEIVFDNYTQLAQEGSFAKVVSKLNSCKLEVPVADQSRPYLLGNTNNEQGYYILPALAAGVTATQKQEDDFLLSSFTCPNMFEAKWRRHYGVPVWQYRYFGHWENLRLYNGSGAYHGTELEMIFGNDDNVSGLPSSAAEDRMTAIMQHAWASFARDPVGGLTELGWPQYDPGKESLVVLARNNRAMVEFVRPSEYDAPCSAVQLGAAATPS